MVSGPIGSANSYKDVLENPDTISKRVLEKGLDASTAFDDVANSLFQPAHFERRLGERALVGVQLVAGGVMRLANGFELGLAMAQLGGPRF